MALSFVVTLQQPLSDAAAMKTYVKTPGRALARESDRLASVARRKDVATLSSFLSEDQEKLRQQMIDEGFDPSKMRLPPERWFPPADALKTIAALFEYVSSNLNDFKQPNPILRDLRAAQTILSAAAEAGVAFHFSSADV